MEKSVSGRFSLSYKSLRTMVFLSLFWVLFSRLGPLYIAPLTGGVYVPEIFLIPIWVAFLCTGKHRISQAVLNCTFSSYSAIFFVILFLLALVGIVVNSDIKSAVGEFRSTWIFGASLIFFYKYSHQGLGIIRNTYIISVIVLLIDSFLTIFIKLDLFGLGGGGAVERISFSPYLILLPLYLSIRMHRFLEFFILSILGAVACFIGGFRAGILVSVLSLLLFVPLILFNLKKRNAVRNLKFGVGTVFLATVFAGGIVILYNNFLADYLAGDKAVYHYVVKRTYYLFIGLFDPSSRDVIFYQDFHRLVVFKLIWKNRFDMILPHGLGLWGGFKTGFGLNAPFRLNTLDNGYFYMIYHYGILLSLIVIGLLAKKITERMKRAAGLVDRGLVVAAVIIFCSLFGINAPFQGIGVSVLIGAFWGMILNPRINYRIVFDRHTKRKSVYNGLFPRKRGKGVIPA